MHELAVVEDLVHVMEEEIKKSGVKKVTQINLVIGELSSLMDESVQMYFEIIAKNSVLENAILKFEHRPALLKCLQCDKEFPHEASFNCPACGSDSILIRNTGNEFYIRSYEGE